MTESALASGHKKDLNRRLPKIARKLIRQRYLSLMLFPAVALVFIFNYVPIAGWYMAFVNYSAGLDILKAKWIGLSNFISFFADNDDYLYILRNTLVLNVSTLVLNTVLAVLFSILLKELVSSKFSRMVQMVSFFPFFISWVITYSFVYSLFASSSGAVNQTLKDLGIIKDSIDLLGSNEYAWPLIIGMNLWKYLGYNSIIFLASIAGIPLEQYEAAEIDGAGRLGRIYYVTLPNLVPTIVVILIMNSGFILNSDFTQYFLFTNSINWEKMEVFDMYIYKYGLALSNYSYATAIGIVRTVVSISILLLVNMFARKATGKAIL